MLRRIIPNTAPALDAEVAAVLLGGWGTHPPEGWNAETSAEAFFDLLLDGDNGLIERWHTHEAYLRGLAKQWNIAPTEITSDGRGLFFFAEALAREVRG